MVICEKYRSGWQALIKSNFLKGNTASYLTGPRFEPQTSSSRGEPVTALPSSLYSSFQSNLSRRSIFRGLTLNYRAWYWIGLGDQANEGDYRWFNGDKASSTDDNLWILGQPNGDEDCCIANFNSTTPSVYDRSCTYSYTGICEKPTISQ